MKLVWRMGDTSESTEGDERVLDLRCRTVMGVINCTPDSFFPESRYGSADVACRKAQAMVSCGAGIIDVGGESTRPGSDPVDVGEECDRVVPVIERLRDASDVAISIDTMKARVAERALDAGADLINDVAALSDPSLRALAAERGVPVVLVHMRGKPKTMQYAPRYHTVIEEVSAELQQAIDRALEAGIAEDRIIVDPGIGFGKRVQDNLMILRDIAMFARLGCPILLGLSNKSFIGSVLKGRGVEGRGAATIAGGCLALIRGVDIIRVHDVESAVDTVRLIEAIEQGELP